LEPIRACGSIGRSADALAGAILNLVN